MVYHGVRVCACVCVRAHVGISYPVMNALQNEHDLLFFFVFIAIGLLEPLLNTGQCFSPFSTDQLGRVQRRAYIAPQELVWIPDLNMLPTLLTEQLS